VRWLGLALSGGPAGQQIKGVGGGAGGFGGVDEHPQTGVGGQVERLVGEVEVADDGMVQPLAAGLVEQHVVAGPQASERLAAGGQFADEVVQVFVVRIATGFGVL
jgi:hypothetical protein